MKWKLRNWVRAIIIKFQPYLARFLKENGRVSWELLHYGSGKGQWSWVLWSTDFIDPLYAKSSHCVRLSKTYKWFQGLSRAQIFNTTYIWLEDLYILVKVEAGPIKVNQVSTAIRNRALTPILWYLNVCNIVIFYFAVLPIFQVVRFPVSTENDMFPKSWHPLLHDFTSIFFNLSRMTFVQGVQIMEHVTLRKFIFSKVTA